MVYGSIESDHLPLLRANTVDVVDEGAEENHKIDETTRSDSWRGRRGSISLLLLAIGAVSAVSVMRGRISPQNAGVTNMALKDRAPRIMENGTPRYTEMSEEEIAKLFLGFVTKYEKFYKDDDEAALRMEIFRQNLARIDERNEASSHVRHEVSVWSDLTLEEYKSFQTFGKVSDEAKAFARSRSEKLDDIAAGNGCQACTRFPELSKYIHGDLPTNFDWRDYAAVTLVKNQAYCGSCWSFSTTGCLEGAWYLSGHVLEQLSEQQLVTCDTKWNQGCNGGWPSLSMVYISNNGGIVPEKIYPYRKVYMGGVTSHPPVCSDVVTSGNYAATLSFVVAVADNTMDEDTLARWLILNGPLSVALDASGMEYYGDGIDMGEYCTPPIDIDHAVLIVGFGEENGVKYWIIKNSWAVWWGERGYYRLVRGENACGIADYATAVIVGKATTAE